MTETRACGHRDPFAVPDSRRHLRHAFYLRHPELDQRTPLDRIVDREAYEAARPDRPAPGDLPDEDDLPESVPAGGRGDLDGLAGAVRDFLDGLLTLEDLAEALGEAEGRG